MSEAGAAQAWVWPAVLVGAAVAWNAGLGCAVPVAAFSAAAALYLTPARAVAVSLAVWAVDEAGQALLQHVALTGPILIWAAIMAVIGVGAALAAGAAARAGGAGWRGVAALAAAFAAYEGGLWVAALAMGGTRYFTAAILARALVQAGGVFGVLAVVHAAGRARGVVQAA